ncbi:MAG: serine--tRNA ligase, partial [Candidatus Zixiibacteriota bacterium]
MLDFKTIREQPDRVKTGAANKNEMCDIDELLELDSRRREIIREVEALKSERNKASAEIASKKKSGQSADSEIAATRQLGDQIAELDEKLRSVESDLQTKHAWVPNLPHESVPIGPDEASNVQVREWGEIAQPDFEILPHWEIGERLGILDLTAAARISGSGF